MVSLFDPIAKSEFDQCQFGRHKFILSAVEIIAGHHENRERTNACRIEILVNNSRSANWIQLNLKLISFFRPRHIPTGTVKWFSKLWMRSIISFSSFTFAFCIRSICENGMPCVVFFSKVFRLPIEFPPFARALYSSRPSSFISCVKNPKIEKSTCSRDFRCVKVMTNQQTKKKTYVPRSCRQLWHFRLKEKDFVNLSCVNSHFEINRHCLSLLYYWPCSDSDQVSLLGLFWNRSCKNNMRFAAFWSLKSCVVFSRCFCTRAAPKLNAFSMMATTIYQEGDANSSACWRQIQSTMKCSDYIVSVRSSHQCVDNQKYALGIFDSISYPFALSSHAVRYFELYWKVNWKINKQMELTNTLVHRCGISMCFR